MSAPTLAKADELELSIASHGRDLIAAYETGDRESAFRFQTAMYSAIAQRTPAKQAQRFSEIDQAIADRAATGGVA